MVETESTTAWLSFRGDVFSDLNTALRKEWLETNGLGGYSSSTICGLNTRRYHGLLVAATRPPRKRMVMLSKLEEVLSLQGREHELSCNQYPGVVHPQGNQYLVGFRLDPFPTYVFEVGGAYLEKAVFMPREKNAVVVRYRLKAASGEVDLRLKPLIACRDHHHLCHENSAINPAAEAVPEGIKFTPYIGAPSLVFSLGDGEFSPDGDWYRNFVYREEMARGLDCQEDLFCPGVFCKRLKPGECWDIVAAIPPTGPIDVNLEWQKEVSRRQALLSEVADKPQYLRQLHLAGDSFLVRGEDGLATVIAGYHWFADWGRDTMIALPGLTLPTGRFREARDVLSSYLRFMDKGLIPNFLGEQDDGPAYNSIDATLWLFVAAYEYVRWSKDLPFLRDTLYPALWESVSWHLKGTHHGISVDRDGLLLGGDEVTQLTWMDAMVDGRAVTSRHGKSVEVNALWYNCCMIMQGFAQLLSRPEDESWFAGLARRARTSFRKVFWNPEKGCLFDCVRDGTADDSVRPNQVFALSLPFPLLSGPKAKQVLHVVERELLVPLGSRSLSPEDSRYVGCYVGDQRQRDGAYHQGTAWPWLLGPFLTAYLRAYKGNKRAREKAREALAAFEDHLSDAGLGTISEILDGDPPHRPRGCISQAWSVAAVLDTYWRQPAGPPVREDKSLVPDSRTGGPGCRRHG